jgi:anaerobic ribonucleoside-triphosphate reductase activating protein
MNYAAIKNCDIANGPGVRVSLFASGCTHRCPDCFNQEAWDFNYGKLFTEETEAELLRMLEPDYVKGLTLLGGEPFDPRNQAAVVSFLRKVKEKLPHKSIWAFTGYVLEKDLLSGRIGDILLVKEYLGYLDVLVDGPYMKDRKNLMLRFRGSDNQRLIDIPATLKTGKTVLWEDWQGERI